MMIYLLIAMLSFVGYAAILKYFGESLFGLEVNDNSDLALITITGIFIGAFWIITVPLIIVGSGGFLLIRFALGSK